MVIVASALTTQGLLKDVTHPRAQRERLAWTARHDPLPRPLKRADFEELRAARVANLAARAPAALAGALDG